jgi:hypothetical protein
LADAIRAITTGHDLRYLWVAAASLAGSMAVVPLIPTGSGAMTRTLLWGPAAVAAGTACACAMAMGLGTRWGAGLAVVAAAFGLCTGASVALASLALRPDVRVERP